MNTLRLNIINLHAPDRVWQKSGKPDHGITGSVLLIIFRSLISLCFITCLIRISFNLKKDQKNRPHDPPKVSGFEIIHLIIWNLIKKILSLQQNKNNCNYDRTYSFYRRCFDARTN